MKPGLQAGIQPFKLTCPETRALLDTVPDAMVIIDDQGRIVLANVQTRVLFGWDEQELIGKPVEVLIPERLAAVHATHRQRYFADPQVRPMGRRIDISARHQDGSEFPAEISLSPLTTEQGMMVSASIRDISERRSVEELERWQMEFSTGVIGSLPGVFYLIDRAARMRQWNSNLEIVTGYSGEEISDMTPLDFFAGDDREKIGAALIKAFDHGWVTVDAPLRAKDGSAREYHFIGHRIHLGDEEFVTGLGIDITPIRRTESALEYISGIQRLLVEASRRFIASDFTHLDKLITEVLGLVGSYCRVDRSYLFRFQPGLEKMDNTHEWCAPGIRAEIDNLQDLPREAVPRVVELMERREVMHVPRVAELGADWNTDRAVFEEESIQSLIVVPIVVGGQLHGFIGFDSVRQERVWDNEEIRLLQVLADLFGVVIQRQSSADALRDSEARYRSVVDNIREVVFQSDNRGCWTFLNPAWEEVTGFSVADSLGRNFREFVYPEDLPGSEREFGALMQGRKGISRSELRYRTWQGGYRWLEVNLRVTEDKNGQIIGCAGTMRDVTRQREAERKMFQLAHYDVVTGLPNRTLALDRLDQLLKSARRSEKMVAVLFLDMDHFKKANDTLGHEAGDRLLRVAADRLVDNIREHDTVARFGGDEFLILLGGLDNAMEAQPVAEKLLESFRDPFELDERELTFTVSVGIAVAPTDGETARDLLRNADIAMYESKVEGRNTYHFFTEEMNHDVERRLAIEEQLRGAMSRDEITLHYQPIVELGSGHIVAAEALARWSNPALGQVPPDEFIAIAEQNGMIDAVGHFVLEQALGAVVKWRRTRPDFRVSVNVSPQQFRDPELARRIGRALKQAGLPGQALRIEVTESVLLGGRHQAGKALNQLKELGVSIAMDDFGTGYASLSYLRRFPFDVLKIDRSFVGDITEDPADCELVVASLALAHSLGLTVIAEGIETVAQLQLLREHACDMGQGFLFGRAMDASLFSDCLSSSAHSTEGFQN
jgi:diguanylate cyclase (GGDEF)-like protein/PAS domain S-box-containing protein